MVRMDDETESRSSRISRWRFSIRGLLAVTFAAALAAAGARHKQIGWNAALLAFVSGLAAAGLLAQAIDLRNAARKLTLSGGERASVRFSVVWRLSIAALLAGCNLAKCLAQDGIISLPERADDFNSVGTELRAGLLCLSLLVAARHSLPPVRRRLGEGGQRLVNLLGALAIALVAFLSWWDRLLIWFFVHVACVGIAESGPLRFAPVGVEPKLPLRNRPFIWACMAAVLISAALFIIVRRLLSRRSSALARCGLVALFVSGLAACCALDYWIGGPGLRRVSPFFAETFSFGPAHLWITALMVVGVLAALLAVRWCALGSRDDRPSVLVWLRDGQPYYHGGVSWALLLAIVAGWRIFELVENESRRGGSYLRWVLDSLFYALIYEPESIFCVALLCVAARRIWRLLLRRPVSAPIEITHFNAQRFALGWLAIVLASCAALPAIAASSFALYLTSWYKLPLPGSP